MTSDRAAVLQAASADAVSLVTELTQTDVALDKYRRKRPLSRTMLQQCDTLAFTWSTKLGVLVGVSTGGGFLLKKAPGGGWSAPLFVTVKEVKAGVLVGVSKVATVLVARSGALAERLAAGSRPVLGVDVALQAWPILGGAESGNEFNLEGTGPMELIAVSTGSGIMLDYSLKGGAMSLDVEKNALCYGAATKAETILSGSVEAPAELKPLYDTLAALEDGKPLPTAA